LEGTAAQQRAALSQSVLDDAAGLNDE